MTQTQKKKRRPQFEVQVWPDLYWRKGHILLDEVEDRFGGAIIKATEGSGPAYWRDHGPWCIAEVSRWRGLGLPTPLYHFARPDTQAGGWEEDATAEASALIDAAHDLVRENLAPSLVRFMDGTKAHAFHDLERDFPKDAEGKHLMPLADRIRWVETLFGVTEDRGLLCGAYTSKDWIDDNLDGQELVVYRRPNGNFRPAWIARYGRQDAVPRPASYPPQEKLHDAVLRRQIVAVHQYTSELEVTNTDGERVEIDANLVYRVFGGQR